MGFLDKFKQEKDLDSGLDLPETGSDPLQGDEPEPSAAVEDEADLSSDPSFRGGPGEPGSDDEVRQDVKLVLEKLDTVKSQLQHVQSKLDKLEADHGSNTGRR